MAQVHFFAYGWFTPALAYLLSVAGAILGLGCAARARAVGARGRRRRWLLLSAVAFGGACAWLLHFMAMFGFDVPDSALRYDVPLTAASMAAAVAGIGLGLAIATGGEYVSPIRVLAGGLFAGAGVVAMHYIGMTAVNITGTIHYDQNLAAAATVIGLAAGELLIFCAAIIRGGKAVVPAAAVIAAAVLGMHYTAMSAVRVILDPLATGAVHGVRPVMLVVPIVAVAALALMGLAVSAMQAMTEEEFDGAATPTADRGAHASL